MKNLLRPTLLGLLALGSLLTAVYAAAPGKPEKTAALGNSYYVYTKALRVEDSGVAAIPARFRWSVETSSAGFDAQGNRLPDSRVMLRLYDPDHNFSALTAQMDLATAARLHHELGEVLVQKLQNPDYQKQVQLYAPKHIPTKRIIGVDPQGVAIVEDAPRPAPTDPPVKQERTPEISP